MGLDPGQSREIRGLIKELGKEMTILLSTHILPEVELVCDRVLIISKGRIVAEDTPAELVNAAGGKGRAFLRLEVEREQAEAVVARYSREEYVEKIEPAGPEHGLGAFLLETDPRRDCRAGLTRIAFEQGWPLLEFKPADMSLEEAFVNLVREEDNHEIHEGVAA